MSERQKPRVLITTPTLSFVEAALLPAYEPVKLWEVQQAAPLPGIRALTCLGHERLDVLLERLPDLGLVACFTTGYDGIDVADCRRRGIEVTHAPGATAHAVAEYAMALMLAVCRNVVAGAQVVASDQWRPGKVLMGRSLKGARLGIVGLGDIGRTLAELAEAFGMHIAWWGPNAKPEAPWPRAATLMDLARTSDVFAICARADASNRSLISADVLGAMSADAILVNVARGQLVDEDALIALLRQGKIGGAALDVFAEEPTPASRWLDVPNVVVTPHIGGATRQSVEKMTALLLENLDSYFSDSPVSTPAP